MSYVGGIGYVMDGSGLANALSTIYAENTTTHILTGHACARAIQAHILTHQALTMLIFEMIDFSIEEKRTIRNLNKFIGEEKLFEKMEEKKYQNIKIKF